MIMRWLFLFVLVVNLSYISWELTKASKTGSTVTSVQSDKSVQSIVLLSERRDTDSITQEKKTRSDHAGDGKPVSTPVAISARKKTVSSPVIKQQKPVSSPVIKQQKPVSSSVTKQQKLSLSGHINNEKVAKSASVGSVSSNTDSPVVGKKTHPVSKVPVSVEEACYTLGPFRDLKKLHKVMRDIKPYVSGSGVRQRKEKERPIFWVYIKPASSRKEVKKKAMRLKKRKIKDYYIIREGDKNNGISLGYFKNRNSAYQLAKKVKKAGFSDVIVESISRSNTSYWLNYRLLATHTIPGDVEKQYLSGKIRRSDQPCVSTP